MAIPDYQTLMLPVLQFLADRLPHSLADIRAKIADNLKLTEAEIAERQPSGYQTLFSNRIAWAVQFLKAAGLITAEVRGVYKLTEKGDLYTPDKPARHHGKDASTVPGVSRIRGQECDII